MQLDPPPLVWAEAVLGLGDHSELPMKMSMSECPTFESVSHKGLYFLFLFKLKLTLPSQFSQFESVVVSILSRF